MPQSTIMRLRKAMLGKKHSDCKGHIRLEENSTTRETENSYKIIQIKYKRGINRDTVKQKSDSLTKRKD